jgi:hypothetical protein
VLNAPIKTHEYHFATPQKNGLSQRDGRGQFRDGDFEPGTKLGVMVMKVEVVLYFRIPLSAHDNFLNNPSSHTNPFSRFMENGYAKHLIQVDIRTLNPHQATQEKRVNVKIIPWENFDPKTAPFPNSPLHVSIGLVALDPAFAPGALTAGKSKSN